MEPSSTQIHRAKVLGTWAPDSEEWLESRRGGIGASDVAAILGVEGAFMTPLKVWADKRGVYVKEENPVLEEMLQWGKNMEPLIAEALANKTGFEVIRIRESLAHPEYDFLRANPDAYIFDPARGWGCAELKNVGFYNLGEWEDSAPLKYQVQLQAQLCVTGLPWGVLAALVGGSRFRHFVMERNDSFIEAMIPKLARFWEMVQNNDMPTGTADDVRILASLHQAAPGSQIALPAESQAIDEALLAAKAAKKEAEQNVKSLEARMWQLLGDNELGALPGGGAYKVITVKREPYRVEATEFKQLRRIGGTT